MAGGMSKAKARRSGRNKQKGRNAWQQAGKPAKAGKRKQYTTGKRKVKSWTAPKYAFIMNEVSDPGNKLVFKDTWKTGDPVMIAR